MTEEVKRTRRKKENPKDRTKTFKESQKRRLERLKAEGYVNLNAMVKKEVKDAVLKIQKENNLATLGEAIQFLVDKLK